MQKFGHTRDFNSVNFIQGLRLLFDFFGSYIVYKHC